MRGKTHTYIVVASDGEGDVQMVPNLPFKLPDSLDNVGHVLPVLWGYLRANNQNLTRPHPMGDGFWKRIA